MADLTRRDFIKYGSMLAGVAAASPVLARVAGAATAPDENKSVSRTTGRIRKAVPSTCQMCHSRCGILAFVENGRVVKIEGNPEHPNNHGKVCAKGQAGINVLYDADRILHPLRRVGGRGEGKWEQISWDEAFDEVASRLKAIRDSGRPEEFIFQSGTAATPRFVARFLGAYGTPIGVNHYAHADYNKIVAQTLTWGAAIEVSDAAHSKYILNFGANPYESHFLHNALVQRLVKGRISNGANLVTFDVRLSNTAGKSDEWFPIKPGTDGAVALAMANVIMREGLHDAQFLEKWTNYPADKLAAHLAQYTPEWAEKISGVRASEITRLAREFAEQKPATTLSGAGASMHYNGTQTERAISLLNAITGNIDIKGGHCLPRTYDLGEPDPLPPVKDGVDDLLAGGQNLSPSVMSRVDSGKQKAGLYMTYMHNPAYSNPEVELNRRVLTDEKLVPFFVSVDIYMTESARLADIILPDTTYLERWDLESGPAFEMVPFVSLRQPVIKPRGESMPFHDICAELAQRIGGGMEKYFSYGTAEGYLSAIIQKDIPGLAAAGGLNYLKEHGVWFDSTAKPSYRIYEKSGFKTSSGKYEIHSQELASRGFPALPTYEQIKDHASLGEHDLVLTTYKPATLTSSLGNSKWLMEIAHDNRILLHSEMALSLGVKTGDKVRLVSRAGAFEGKIRVTQGIEPRTVAVSGALGRSAAGVFALAEKEESSDPDTKLVWWESHGKGISPNPAFVASADPIGGGQAWHDTVVSIQAV